MSIPSHVEIEPSMSDFLALAQPGVQKLSPHAPDKPVDGLARELSINPVAIAKLTSNENLLGTSPEALGAIRAEPAEPTRYPDGNDFELKRKLTEHCVVDTVQATLGNGSSDILDLVTRIYPVPGLNAVFSEHAFIVYLIATQAMGTEGRAVKTRAWRHDLEAVLTTVGGQTRVVFVASPNNPTGTRFDAGALKRFLAQAPAKVLMVLNEAHIEYAEDDELSDGSDYLARHLNLLVSRTFSKAYSLAPLWADYVLSSKAVANVLNRVYQPLNVNSLALAAACVTLDDHDYPAQSRRLNDSGMAQLEDDFHTLGLSWIPSKGNLIIVDLVRSTDPVYQALLREGVIVRPAAGYGMPTFLCVSIGLPEENGRFLQALGKVLTHN